MTVTETFFAIEVGDMDRATAFYVQALDAAVVFASPRWSSLMIAGVRVGLGLSAGRAPGRVGLHFVVTDLAAARAGVERAGGRIVAAALEPAPGVLIAEVTDTEGNTFTLTAGAA